MSVQVLSAESGLAVGSHGDLADLGVDDHLQYLLLAGRAGGQSAFGGTAAGDILGLEGADAAPDTGRVHINSPVEYFYDAASNTTPAEPFLQRWRAVTTVPGFVTKTARNDGATGLLP